MIDKQKEIEFQYSKKHIHSTVMDYIDSNHLEFSIMIEAINTYREKEYDYVNKNLRVAKLNMLSDEIALEIIIATILCTDIIPVQGICTKLCKLGKYDNIIDGVKTAAELLAVTEGFYFDLYHSNHPDNTTGTMGIMGNIKLDLELESFLNMVQ